MGRKYYYDSDDSGSGYIYAYDNEEAGIGVFMLLIIAAIPLLFVSVILQSYANAVTQHPVIAALVYCVATVVLSYMLNKSPQKKYRLLGMIATIISMVPFAATQVVYAIPAILISESFFGLVFEWLFLSVIVVGVTIFVITLGNASKNGIVHLVFAIIFLVITLVLVGPPEDMALEDVWKLYG